MNGRSRVANRYRSRLKQSGAVGLTLALIAMLTVNSFVVPMLIRASNASQLRTVGPINTEDSRSAVEHVFWSLENDPDFLTNFQGNPPTHTYELNVGKLSADVSVSTPGYGNPSQALDLAMTVSPALIPEDTWTEVDFELTVTNNSSSEQEIDQVEVFPQSPSGGDMSSNFIAGSSSGFETSDPSVVSGGWRWNVWPYKTIGPLGESATHTWRLDINADENNYWFDVLVHTVGGDTIHVPIETTVKSSNESSNYSATSTTVPKVVEADTSQTYDVQIILLNTNSSKKRVNRIRHTMPSQLSFVNGSASGLTTANASTSSGQGPDGTMNVLTWSFSGSNRFDLDPHMPLQLSFQVQGSLPVGRYTSESRFRVVGEDAHSDEYTASSGQYVAISTARTYDVSIDQDDLGVDVEAWLVSGKPVVTSVRER